jgi:hypothetical protein
MKKPCVHTSKIVDKKTAEYLAVSGIFLNTHTHTHRK